MTFALTLQGSTTFQLVVLFEPSNCPVSIEKGGQRHPGGGHCD
jgi:hypothetical protein